MSETQLTADDLMGRGAVILDPPDSRGWFGGTPVHCIDPCVELVGVDLADAAALLRCAFDDEDGMVVAACIGYDGTSAVRVYEQSSSLALAPDLQTLPASTPLLANSQTTMGRAEYIRAVVAAQELIADGDVYVLNLTYGVKGRSTTDALSSYRALRSRAGSRMNALWAAEDVSVLSVSPERFLSLHQCGDGYIHAAIEPIKGTRPRDLRPDVDAQLRAELLACAKERAEHVMVVDMERNDLGRVALSGGVRVSPLLDAFVTPYCHQLTSTVQATLPHDVPFADLFEAAFPCGSVTGAPKRAAMSAIDILETEPRGVYTGALVVAYSGRLDSSVLIRTLEHGGATGRWGTGCGITIESDPEAEWDESVLKSLPVTGGRSPEPGP